MRLLLPIPILFIIQFFAISAGPAFSASLNGFVLDAAIIDKASIQRGGPPKDGIPALDDPKFIPAEEAVYLKGEDRILGIAIDGTAKAYPIGILNWHEVVNDRIGDIPLLVSYCPLCGTGMVFSRSVEGQTLDFGVSGLLFNSDVLMYDRQSESLWSQIRGQAVTGRHAGTDLTLLAASHTSWKRWRQQYPETFVLSRDTGHDRDYDLNPYAGYGSSERLYFPVQHRAEGDMALKETVLGIAIGDRHKAYPFSLLKKWGRTSFRDSLAGTDFTVHWDEEGYSARIVGSDGVELPTVQAFWFAWYAFHPHTDNFALPGK